jgi:hypothetical protein
MSAAVEEPVEYKPIPPPEITKSIKRIMKNKSPQEKNEIFNQTNNLLIDGINELIKMYYERESSKIELHAELIFLDKELKHKLSLLKELFKMRLEYFQFDKKEKFTKEQQDDFILYLTKLSGMEKHKISIIYNLVRDGALYEFDRYPRTPGNWVYPLYGGSKKITYKNKKSKQIKKPKKNKNLKKTQKNKKTLNIKKTKIDFIDLISLFKRNFD